MKKFNYKYYLRISHRYLGFFIGIQFLCWTLGGLYFSWTKIKEVRGEHLRQKTEAINTNQAFVSPQIILDRLRRDKDVEFGLAKLQIVEILNKPYYEINMQRDGKTETVLADAASGEIRPPVSEQEARGIASAALMTPAAVSRTQYLTKENVSGHHEYREKPLPAWAVTFDTPEKLTVYLAAENGQISTFRTNGWRVFDFLWMLHTMDYENRDNINNYLLRAFSILGILTVISGFLLFFVSSKFFKRLLRL